MKAVTGVLVGLLTGVLSGFGVGGGTLLILWLTFFGGMDQLHAGGVNLLYFCVCALPALWGHRKEGLLETRGLLQAAAAGAPASLLGALLAAWLDVTLLRRLFGAALLIVAARELFGASRKNTEGGPKKGKTEE